MGLPRILYSDLSRYGLNASAESVDHPLQNLRTYDPADYWSSGSTSNPQFLSIDFGATGVRGRDFVLIDGHNFGTLQVTASIYLEASSDPSFVSGSVIVPSLAFPNDERLYIEFPSVVTQRFWRIVVSGSILEPPRIGQVFIDSRLEFTTPYDFGYVGDDPEFQTYETTTLSGRIRSSQVWGERQSYDLSFKLLNDDIRTKYLDFQQTVRGRLRPWYFVDTDDSLHFVHTERDWTPVVGFRPGRSSVQRLVFKSKDVE